MIVIISHAKNLIHNLLILLQNILHHLLNRLQVSLSLSDLRQRLKPLILPLRDQLPDPLRPPSVPLVDQPLPVCQQLGRNVALLGSILLVELPAELPEVLANSLLVVFGEERCGSWTPDELLEFLLREFMQILTLEVPKVVPSLRLNFGSRISLPALNRPQMFVTHRTPPSTRTRGQIPPTRIPSQIRHSVMLIRRQQLHARSRIGIVLLARGRVVEREVDVPEFNVVLDGRTDGGEGDEATFR